jgi:hypothetical protein
MADTVIELLKRKVNALESAYSEIRRRFDRASENGLDTLTSQSLFVAPMLHGPYRNSVDGTHSMTFIVDYDENIAYLYSAKLKLRLAAVRSNVSASSSASGGGSAPTSSAGSAHTHSVSQSLTGASGGGTTVSSAGGSSHSHALTGSATATESATISLGALASVSTITVSAGTSHNHASATTDDALPNSPHQHAVSGGSGSEASHTHSWTGAWNTVVAAQNHTHSVSGITSAAESSHTHSVTLSDHTHTISGTITAASESAHTHSVTISAHSHTITLTYGIYEGSAPSAPAITITINGVNRTTALGGSWNADTTLDITDYLRDTAKIPLRQDNTIVLTSAELIDLEVVCRSLVTTRLVTT